MKKIFLAFLGAFALLSCSESRLDIPQKGVIATEDFYQTDGDAEMALIAAYETAATQYMAFWWNDNIIYALWNYPGDDIYSAGENKADGINQNELHTFRYPINNAFIETGYKSFFQAVYAANLVIDNFKDKADTDIKKRAVAEALVLRSLSYLQLAIGWGTPPIVDHVLAATDRPTNAESQEAVLDFIVSSIDEALPHLGNRQGSGDKNGIYRATKDLANTIKGKALLWKGDYAGAQAALKEVINSGNYSLLSRDNFMKYNTFTPENNDESIFVVKCVASEYSGYDHYYGIGGMYANIGGMGWGEMYASAKYIDLLNETGRNDWRPDNYKIVDARAAFIEPTYDASHKLVFRFIKKDSETVENYAQFDAVKNGATVTCKDAEGTSYTLTPVSEEEEIYTIDYKGATYEGVLDYFITLNRVYPQFYITKCSREGEDSHLHSPIISRLGEIYLNRAEAYAKLGNYGAALNDLNIIRERSIVGGGYASLDASNAGDLIDKERQLELAYQAERSYDVFRNGKPLDRTFPGPHNQAEIVEASDYRVTYYIPQNAINAYPGTLTQNPTNNSGVILN